MTRITLCARRFGSSSALVALVSLSALLLTGCPAGGLSPSITGGNEPNQIGGTIVASGTGFTPGGTVRFTLLGVPGRGSNPLSIGFINADGYGNFSNFAYEYTFNAGSGLPGCVFGSTDTVDITLVATDGATGATAIAGVTVPDCGF